MERCDVCDVYGIETPATLVSEFSVEQLGSSLFRHPRPLRFCDACATERAGSDEDDGGGSLEPLD